MTLNYEFERHIQVATPEGARVLRGMQDTFNALVRANLVRALPDESLDATATPELFTDDVIPLQSLDDITIEAWRSRACAPAIIDLLYVYDPKPESDSSNALITRGRNAFMVLVDAKLGHERRYGTSPVADAREYPDWVYNYPRRSMSELVRMYDRDFLIDERNIGVKVLRVFRELTQPFVEKFETPQQA